MPNKHLIFLVHGMGTFGKNWSKEARNIIESRFDSYPKLGWMPFKDRFEFREIVYDNVFEEVREAWRKQRKTLAAVLQLQGITEGAISTLNKLAKVTEKKSFLNTHVLDVLLYRFVKQLSADARDTVRAQILTELAKQDSTERLRWSIVAHSLGTAVVHDSLHELYTDRIGEMDEKLGAVTRPRMLMMVANVSRVLETFKDVYESLVKPGSPADDCMCRYYLNVRHEWDPFPMPKRFKPADNWPSLEIRADPATLFRSIETNAIEDINVHSFEHYLRNPSVHIPMFHALTDSQVIDHETARNAHLKYVAKTPIEKFGEFARELKNFQLGEEDTWTKTVKAWRGFKEVAEGLT